MEAKTLDLVLQDITQALIEARTTLAEAHREIEDLRSVIRAQEWAISELQDVVRLTIHEKSQPTSARLH